MSRRTDREQLVAQLTRELPQLSASQVVELARKLSRAGATLQRYAEMACSDEWACNVDRVPCPSLRTGKGEDCCCDDHGSATATVPRFEVRAHRLRKRMTGVLAPLGLVPYFQGDPRGPVLSVFRAGVSEADKQSGRERGIYVA